MKIYYPKDIETIIHKSSDGRRTYRLDGIEKITRLKSTLENEFEIVEVESKDMVNLDAIHSEEYLNSLKTGIPKSLAESSGILWQPQLLQVFANSAESLISASYEALKNKRSASISKGGHHAVRERGYGFNPVCEIAIAVRSLLKENESLSIAVVDLDIHLGNGLQALLSNVPNVTVFDLWSKKMASWNEVNATNIISKQAQTVEEYWNALEVVVDELHLLKPDLIIYHSGMDVFYKDRMGGIEGFTEVEIKKREETIMQLPYNIALVLGGGYVDHSTSESSLVGMEKLVNLHKISFDLLKL